MSPTLLEVRSVTKRFPGVLALDEVNFELEAGEIHALLGENGAGKSTLIKVLGGAHRPDQGAVTLTGSALPLGDPVATQARGIQVIYQELTLIPELSVAENVFLGRELGGWFLDRETMRTRTREILDRLGAGFTPDARAGALSVAEQQLVEIARALAIESKVLVLDEPTSTLPQHDVERLFDVLRALRAEGLGIVYISHRLDEIFALTDRVTVLRDGKWVETSRTADTDRPSLIRSMVGRTLEEEFPPRSPEIGDPVLEARGLRATGRFEDVSLTVSAGEIVGLYGLVGAGRTSTALALFGDLPFEGEARLDGSPYAPRSPLDALRAGVGYITEDRKAAGIFPELETGTNVTITFLRDFVRRGFVSGRAEREAAAASCARFSVRSTGLEQPAGTLSGGNQQKLLLARHLLRSRRVLILDEPTRGIDVGAKSEIYELMNQLTAEGLGILMISSELPEILGISDRVVVLRDGVVTGELDRADASQERILELATREEAA